MIEFTGERANPIQASISRTNLKHSILRRRDDSLDCRLQVVSGLTHRTANLRRSRPKCSVLQKASGLSRRRIITSAALYGVFRMASNFDSHSPQRSIHYLVSRIIADYVAVVDIGEDVPIDFICLLRCFQE